MSDTAQFSPNHFLASLAPEDFELLRPDLETVELRRDDRLAEAGHRLAFVHLPLNSILSIITVMRNGEQVESRTVGRESGYGLLQALGVPRSHERMLCQVAGAAVRIPVQTLSAAALRRPGLLRAIAAHAQVTQIQTSQTLACNALHSVGPRLARWLLMTQDRLGGDVLPLTQEHLSVMLGVQRTTVTAVAQELQAQGVIGYSRGRITVHSRRGLMARSCECYDDVEQSVAAIFDALPDLGD